MTALLTLAAVVAVGVFLMRWDEKTIKLERHNAELREQLKNKEKNR